MAKADKHIRTLDDAIKVYGGRSEFIKAFWLKRNGPHKLGTWYGPGGIPRGDHLGLYLGLQARGYQPTPELFGLSTWDQFLGVTENGRAQLPAE